MSIIAQKKQSIQQISTGWVGRLRTYNSEETGFKVQRLYQFVYYPITTNRLKLFEPLIIVETE